MFGTIPNAQDNTIQAPVSTLGSVLLDDLALNDVLGLLVDRCHNRVQGSALRRLTDVI